MLHKFHVAFICYVEITFLICPLSNKARVTILWVPFLHTPIGSVVMSMMTGRQSIVDRVGLVITTDHPDHHARFLWRRQRPSPTLSSSFPAPIFLPQTFCLLSFLSSWTPHSSWTSPSSWTSRATWTSLPCGHLLPVDVSSLWTSSSCWHLLAVDTCFLVDISPLADVSSLVEISFVDISLPMDTSSRRGYRSSTSRWTFLEVQLSLLRFR